MLDPFLTLSVAVAAGTFAEHDQGQDEADKRADGRKVHYPAPCPNGEHRQGSLAAGRLVVAPGHVRLPQPD